MDFQKNFKLDAMIPPSLLPHHNHTCLLSILSFLGHLLDQFSIYQSIFCDQSALFVSILQILALSDQPLSLFFD
jgi:hypothetical protein